MRDSRRGGDVSRGVECFEGGLKLRVELFVEVGDDFRVVIFDDVHYSVIAPGFLDHVPTIRHFQVVQE